ncbi:hypothetical protein [Sphingomonas fennica]|uniref:Uncharacterized protein n=1 Tax=Edaphosphingomonas fennica TaxID=114404 RepID=A0A2T4HX79_9SPHN|nr:hypothetical protein [Sphingomonas fennica]PTD20434.1 hypothetical protein CV103_11390 [Sphingomonas fennica]
MNMHTALSTFDRETKVAWRAALARVESARAIELEVTSVVDRAETRFFAWQKRVSGPVRFRAQDTVETLNARIAKIRTRTEAARRDMDEAHAAQGEANRTCDAAVRAALAVPAPDMAIVLQKFELAAEFGLEIEDIGPLLADLRRMGGH